MLTIIKRGILMAKVKQPKYKPGTIYKISVVFERDGEDVEALIAKFKTHKYYMIEEKYV